MVSPCETDIYSCAIAKLLAISLGSAPSHSIRDAREGCKVVVPHKLVGRQCGNAHTNYKDTTSSTAFLCKRHCAKVIMPNTAAASENLSEHHCDVTGFVEKPFAHNGSGVDLF